MKALFLSMLVSTVIAIPALADQTLSTVSSDITLGSGNFQETYKTVVSHGLAFRCLVLKESKSSWGISVFDYEETPKLKKEIAESVSNDLTEKIKANADYCKTKAWMNDRQLQQERDILTELAQDLSARLIGLTGGMSAEELSNSTDSNLVACVTDLVNVENLNQITSRCNQQ